MAVTLKKVRPAYAGFGDHAAELRRAGCYAVLIDGVDTGYRVGASNLARAWEGPDWDVLDSNLNRVRGSFETRRQAVAVAVHLARKGYTAYKGSGGPGSPATWSVFFDGPDGIETVAVGLRSNKAVQIAINEHRTAAK